MATGQTYRTRYARFSVLDVQLRRPVAPDDIEALRTVTALAQPAAGHPVVGDAVWSDLAAPSNVTALVVARAGDSVVGVLHLGVSDSQTAPHETLSVAVVPDEAAPDVVAALATVALEDHRRRGGGPLELWVFGADRVWDDIPARLGLKPARELQQLRVPLPVAESPRWPRGVTTRTFVPGRDEAAWLAVNNRAFARDPDQGGWTPMALTRREHEPWFDPQGFLLAVEGDTLAGFCWTKRHPPASPVEPVALGEIYVIGVDPAYQGRGLGRALVIAGLVDLHDRQRAPVGMLFVDAANEAAIALYQSLGFSLTRVDRAYAWQ
jgi:mycothiol synthase